MKLKRDNDTWYAELCALSFGTLLLALAGFVFYRLNNRPTSVWKIAVTPNACLSIVITIIEACVVFTLCSAMGQLKWVVYKEKPQSLAEMQVFDDASRKSLVGGAKLLTGRGGYIQSPCPSS